MRTSTVNCLAGMILIACLYTRPAAGQNANALPLLIDSAATPTVFAPGVVSSPYTEWATSFTPDGHTIYFSRGAVYWTIVSAKNVAGHWNKPEVVDFSGKFNDTDPFVTPDGKKLFFISNRPLPGAPQDKGLPYYHIWYVDRVAEDHWSEPHHLDSLVNVTGLSNYAPSISSKGTLYFCSRDREGHKGMQSFYVTPEHGYYGQPKLLSVDSLDQTQDPFIAPDEHYLILLSGNDLYWCMRKGDGWSAPHNMGPQVNNGDSNSSPYVSPDGKTLYYSSPRIIGFYKRDRSHALNYDQLIRENESLFNSQPNILAIPVRLPNS